MKKLDIISSSGRQGSILEAHRWGQTVKESQA